jgi:hypothetical protein
MNLQSVAPEVACVLRQAKEEAVKKLLGPNSNVVGVGIGKRVKGGKETAEDCVRVYVVSKNPDPNDLSSNSKVPSSFCKGAVGTDVIEVGRFGRRRVPLKPRGATPPKPPRSTNPQPGSLIRVKTNAPNVNEGFRGTLGAVVTDGTDKYILSCNHVLARNGRVPEKHATIVSAEFVGTQGEIAKPGCFVEIDPDGGNSVDCALAVLPLNGNKVHAMFPDGFKLSPDGPDDPKPDMKVTKFGGVTHQTSGTIVDTDVDLCIEYSFGTFRFEHQVMIDGGCIGDGGCTDDDGEDNVNHFAAAGDSGSIVIDESTYRPIGIVFAASGRFAVACPLKTALEKLKPALEKLTEKDVSKLEITCTE